jgi:hypothetical protein
MQKNVFRILVTFMRMRKTEDKKDTKIVREK